MSDEGSEDIPLNNVHVSASSGFQNPASEALTPVTMPGESPVGGTPTPPQQGTPRSGTPLDLDRPSSGQAQSYQNPQYQNPNNPYQQQQATNNPYQQQQGSNNPYQQQQQDTNNPYQQQQGAHSPYGQPGGPQNPYGQQGAQNPYGVQHQQGAQNPYGVQPQQQGAQNPYGQQAQQQPAYNQGAQFGGYAQGGPKEGIELTHRGHAGGAGGPSTSNENAYEADDTFDDTETRQFGPLGWTLLTLFIICTFPFSLLCFVKILLVKDYERVVIQRLGRMLGSKGPGIVVVFPCLETFNVVGMRTMAMDVPPQVILTKDSVSVNVDAVVYYRITNPRKSVQNIEDAHYSTSLVAQTTLRNLLGTRNMAGILAEREEISKEMLVELDTATDPWGIKVERVEVKDVRIPFQLQRAMAAEAEASREAKAKLIHAQAEQAASVKLKEAADVIAQSPAAMQLRFLQTLSSVSVEKDTTILFPLPIDILPQGWQNRNKKVKQKMG